MLRKTLWTAAAAATLAVPAAQAQTNTFGGGSTFASPALTGFTTPGNLMTGMLVTWGFVGGGGGSASWSDLGGGNHGVSSGGFSVQLGSFTDTFGGTWALSNGTGSILDFVRFNGAPGRTIFDCGWNGSACDNTGTGTSSGTDGSASGWSLTNNGGSFGGTVTGAYTNRVGINPNGPVGDLFEQLLISFGGGLASGGTYQFIADADNSDFRFDPPTPVGTVPEPATMTLMATGLAAMAASRRRRQQKS